MVKEQKYNIYIYGSYLQMFFSIKIHTKTIHHEFSWCFSHTTAVPLTMTSNHNILIYNDYNSKEGSENDAYLCAWESSGGSKHASAIQI